MTSATRTSGTTLDSDPASPERYEDELSFQFFAVDAEERLRLAMLRFDLAARRRNPPPREIDARAIRAAVRRKDVLEILRLTGLSAKVLEGHLSHLSGWFRGSYSDGVMSYLGAASAVLYGADAASARRHVARLLDGHDRSRALRFDAGFRSAPQRQSVLALAAASQAMYDEPELRLYRGIYEAQGSSLRELLRSMGALHWKGVDPDRHDPVGVDLGPVSSWTESRKRATLFAQGYGVRRKVRASAVLRMRVPLKDVAFSWRLLRSGVAGEEVGLMAARDQEVGVFSVGSARITLDDIDLLRGWRGEDW